MTRKACKARRTLSERIQLFESVHKGRYDYSLVKGEIFWYSKIPVICEEHGIFESVANNHQRGAGCPSCAGVKKLSRSERIAQAIRIHGNRYDFKLWPDDLTGQTRVTTICPDHGNFEHTVASMVNQSSGCPSCANNLHRTLDKFIEQAKMVHGDKYSYSNYDNLGNNSPISIGCSIHGQFTQLVTNHLYGKGCPSCGEYGYNPDKEGHLYMLKSSCGRFCKVGISNNLSQRLKQLTTSTPFKWEFKGSVCGKGSTMRSIEKLFHATFNGAGMTGFSGCTEWMLWDDNIDTWCELLGVQ